MVFAMVLVSGHVNTFGDSCCRRSAVSRQACHLVGKLAEVLGHSFGGLALHFVDDLLKMVVITIQVTLMRARYCAQPQSLSYLTHDKLGIDAFMCRVLFMQSRLWVHS